MAVVSLIRIIKDAQTLAQAFDKLRDMEIMVETELGSSYIPLDVREEFVILEDNGGDRR